MTDYLYEHHAISLYKVAERLGVSPSAAKQDAAVIVQRLIDDGPPEISIADLEAGGAQVKTVRVPTQDLGNKPFEPMTFPAFDPFVLQNETWETSALRRDLRRLLIVVTRGKKSQPLRLFTVDFGFFWSPTTTQSDLISGEWEEVRRRIANGRADDLPKETHALLVKPKGASGADRVPAPGGVRMPRSGFALAPAFIEQLIDET